MKKEEIKVKIQSVEHSKKIEQILLALGEPLAENYSMEKERYNFLIYSPEKIKGDEYGWLCFTDDEKLKEITFGQLIDLLNQPKRNYLSGGQVYFEIEDNSIKFLSKLKETTHAIHFLTKHDLEVINKAIQELS